MNSYEIWSVANQLQFWQVYSDGDRHQKAARQFINKLQCRICEKVFHKAFGLEFHMAHEHSSNEVPKKTFEVKTFVDRRGLPRGSKGAGKKSSKKSKKKGKKGTSNKDWDLEKAWMNDDSDESDGQVRIINVKIYYSEGTLWSNSCERIMYNRGGALSPTPLHFLD